MITIISGGSEDFLHPSIQAINNKEDHGTHSVSLCSPDRPAAIRNLVQLTTSPAPDSNSEFINSQSLNASVEYDKGDFEVPPFDFPAFSRDRWKEIPVEEFHFPKITTVKAGIQLLELSAEWNVQNFAHNSRMSENPSFSFTNPLFGLPNLPDELKLAQFHNLTNHFTKSETLPEDQFIDIKGKFQVIEKIGEGTFSSVYKAISISDPNKRIVALKRIYATCRPARILNEIQHLKNLGGSWYVPKLLGGIRSKDQVTLILPYFEHDKFKDYLFVMSLHQIKCYMIALFQSLHHLHSQQVMHRDIKPGNFLYNIKTEQFMLVDFGLAQLQSEAQIPPSSPTERKRASPDTEAISPSAKKVKSDGAFSQSMPNLNSFSSVSSSSPKKVMQAPRAGTRGFRAPEVLLKYPNQTVAIDIWSAGVIFLCILSMRYPFFNSPDDLAALAEIAAVLGTRQIQEMALSLGRRVHLPVEIPPVNLMQLCLSLSNQRNYVIPESAYDLLARCLDLDPHKRISAADALKHPFLNS